MFNCEFWYGFWKVNHSCLNYGFLANFRPDKHISIVKRLVGNLINIWLFISATRILYPRPKMRGKAEFGNASPGWGSPGGNGSLKKPAAGTWLPGPLATEEPRAAGRREVRAPGPSPLGFPVCGARGASTRAAARAPGPGSGAPVQVTAKPWERAPLEREGFSPPRAPSPEPSRAPQPERAEDPGGRAVGAQNAQGLRLLSFSFVWNWTSLFSICKEVKTAYT